MSDIVEVVADAIRAAQEGIGDDEDYRGMAKAAIEAMDLDHVRALQRDDRATAIAAIAERDAANAELEAAYAVVADLKHEMAWTNDQ